MDTYQVNIRQLKDKQNNLGAKKARLESELELNREKLSGKEEEIKEIKDVIEQFQEYEKMLNNAQDIKKAERRNKIWFGLSVLIYLLLFVISYLSPLRTFYGVMLASIPVSISLGLSAVNKGEAKAKVKKLKRLSWSKVIVSLDNLRTTLRELETERGQIDITILGIDHQLKNIEILLRDLEMVQSQLEEARDNAVNNLMTSEFGEELLNESFQNNNSVLKLIKKINFEKEED